MELFHKNNQRVKAVNYFRKSAIVDVRLCSKYALYYLFAQNVNEPIHKVIISVKLNDN